MRAGQASGGAAFVWALHATTRDDDTENHPNAQTLRNHLNAQTLRNHSNPQKPHKHSNIPKQLKHCAGVRKPKNTKPLETKTPKQTTAHVKHPREFSGEIGRVRGEGPAAHRAHRAANPSQTRRVRRKPVPSQTRRKPVSHNHCKPVANPSQTRRARRKPVPSQTHRKPVATITIASPSQTRRKPVAPAANPPVGWRAAYQILLWLEWDIRKRAQQKQSTQNTLINR